MRHGRKTRTRPFTGYKRHVMKALDADVIVGATVRPANEPEHLTLARLLPDASSPRAARRAASSIAAIWRVPQIATLHAAGTVIRAKAWTSAQRRPVSEAARSRSISAQQQVTCPGGRTRRRSGPAPARSTFQPPRVTRVTVARPCTCAHRRGDGRSRCIRRKPCSNGSARAMRTPPDGRATLRQRTGVEHSLARLEQMQGPEGPLQRRAQEHARCPPMCRGRQSRASREIEDRGVITLLSSLVDEVEHPRPARPGEEVGDDRERGP